MQEIDEAVRKHYPHGHDVIDHGGMIEVSFTGHPDNLRMAFVLDAKGGGTSPL